MVPVMADRVQVGSHARPLLEKSGYNTTQLSAARPSRGRIAIHVAGDRNKTGSDPRGEKIRPREVAGAPLTPPDTDGQTLKLPVPLPDLLIP